MDSCSEKSTIRNGQSYGKRKCKDKSDRVKVLETYINDLKANKNKLSGFDEGLFYALVDKVKVNKNDIRIIWKDGTES